MECMYREYKERSTRKSRGSDNREGIREVIGSDNSEGTRGESAGREVAEGWRWEDWRVEVERAQVREGVSRYPCWREW